MQEGLEIWEKIPDTTNLFISNKGRILSMAQGQPRIVSGKKNQKGYIRFRYNGKAVFVHRIVAEVFLQKPNSEQTQINHINGDKTDNRAINLEWCTPGENLKHSYETLGRIGSWAGKKRKPISEAQREKQRKAMKEYFKRNPDVIEKMRRDRIGKNCLGENPRAIKTVCYETGEVFSCSKEAAIKLNVHISCIRQSIHKGSMVAGKYHFYQIKENDKGEKN